MRGTTGKLDASGVKASPLWGLADGRFILRSLGVGGRRKS